MSIWSGSRYEGEYKDGWYHGHGTNLLIRIIQILKNIPFEIIVLKYKKGKFIYPSGVIYEGQFVKG